MENDYLMKIINMMNNKFFKCRKLYNEGMHELSKELLRINEIELDKVINNSIRILIHCFDIFKANYNSGQSKNDLLRLPIIVILIKKLNLNYQIYTLLYNNKDILDKLDNCIFPIQVKIKEDI